MEFNKSFSVFLYFLHLNDKVSSFKKIPIEKIIQFKELTSLLILFCFLIHERYSLRLNLDISIILSVLIFVKQ